MNAPRPSPQDDARLHALVDGRLPPDEAARLRTSLDAPAQGETEAWEHQRLLLRQLHGDWLERPVPDTLRHAADRLQEVRAERQRWAAWGGMAAGWVLAFGLGWAVHGHWGAPPGRAATLATAPSAPQLFAQQAALAHAVYQPEQRHPVEVTAAQQDHLVQWLSKRLARPLTVPHLEEQGFELVGGRLLPGGAGARAQFMYQNAAGVRITLYLGALEDAQGAQATAFHFHSEGPVHGFYWVEQGFGYALSGELPRPALQALATAVYRQLPLSAAPPAGASVPARGS